DWFVRPARQGDTVGEFATTFAATDVPVVTPTLKPRDEAIFWLTTAAEIEHFLMVHYLFAAYSLNPDGTDDQVDDVQMLRATLLQIAREEMGHLITVQNLLSLIGGPLHFGREHSPHASEVYPFRFHLERVSGDSLAKYAMAESPIDRAVLEAGLPPADLAIYDNEIERRATISNGGHPVRHVGPVFARLRQLFELELKVSDFRLDRASRQASWADWGYKPNPADNVETDLKVLVHRFDQTNPEDARKQAVDAIQEIGDQGEEADIDLGNGESHFERFFEAYKIFTRIQKALGRPPVWPVVANPNVAVAIAAEDRDTNEVAESRLSEPRSRHWAQLFNLRYRLLLRFLAHALHLEGPVFLVEGPTMGDRTVKGMVTYWTFKEMRRIKKIADKLVQLRARDDELGPHAGPPFELPYRLDLAPDEADRWADHADVLRASSQLIAKMQEHETDRDDPFLTFLAADDGQAADIADLLSKGDPTAGPVAEKEFRKVAVILDEAVRGFSVSKSHMSFWQGVNLQEFLEHYLTPVVPGDADASPLMDRIDLPENNERRMPRYRPRIDPSRVDYIRDWIERGAPDSTPPGQIGVEAEPDPKVE
ncbi:MAG: ferritin-like domain-containing protein, partial [Myxococcota bacterium]